MNQMVFPGSHGYLSSFHFFRLHSFFSVETSAKGNAVKESRALVKSTRRAPVADIANRRGRVGGGAFESPARASSALAREVRAGEHELARASRAYRQVAASAWPQLTRL